MLHLVAVQLVVENTAILTQISIGFIMSRIRVRMQDTLLGTTFVIYIMNLVQKYKYSIIMLLNHRQN